RTIFVVSVLCHFCKQDACAGFSYLKTPGIQRIHFYIQCQPSKMPKPKKIPKKRVNEYLASLNKEDEANNSIPTATSPRSRITRQGLVSKEQNEAQIGELEDAMEEMEKSIKDSDTQIVSIKQTTRSASQRVKEIDKPLLETTDKLDDDNPTEKISNLIEESETAGLSSVSTGQIKKIDKRSREYRNRKLLGFEDASEVIEKQCINDSISQSGNIKCSTRSVLQGGKKIDKDLLEITDNLDVLKPEINRSNLIEDRDTKNMSSISCDQIEEADKSTPNRGIRKRKRISYNYEDGGDDGTTVVFSEELDKIETTVNKSNVINDSETACPSNVSNNHIEQIDRHSRGIRKRKSISYKFEPGDDDSIFAFSDLEDEDDDKPYVPDGKNSSNDEGDEFNTSNQRIKKFEKFLKRNHVKRDLVGKFHESVVSTEESTTENEDNVMEISITTSSPENLQKRRGRQPSSKNKATPKKRTISNTNKVTPNEIVNSDVIPGITKLKSTKRSLAPKKKATQVKVEPTVQTDDPVPTDDSNVIKKEPVEKKKRGRKPKTVVLKTEDLINENIDPLAISPDNLKGRRRKKKGRKRRIGVTNTALNDDVILPGVFDGETEREEETEEEDNNKGGLVKRRKKRSHGEPYSVTGNWYIALGYLQDLNILLKAWDSQPGWRYKDFAECWCDKKFTLIYRGRQNFKELLEYSEELALLTKKFIVPPHKRKWRIGALFTLYGLFYKHPMRHFFKIRLTLEEYKLISELVAPFRTQKDNPDPAYIFRKMEVEGAFFNTASSLEMCLDFHSAERESVNADYEAQRLAKTSSVSYVLTSDSLQVDDQLMQYYAQVKENSVGEVLQAAVNMVDVNMADRLQERMNNLKQDSLICLGLNDGAKDGAAKHGISIKDALTIAQRRNIVRTKAMSLNPNKVRGGHTPDSKESTPQNLPKKPK
ncbi:unnamed protein product, partial [Meganyctiphanes norvegica]